VFGVVFGAAEIDHFQLQTVSGMIEYETNIIWLQIAVVKAQVIVQHIHRTCNPTNQSANHMSALQHYSTQHTAHSTQQCRVQSAE